MSIFNPYHWKKAEIKDITDETLLKLDDRYINTGENVLDQNIENLNAINVNIATQGKLYFNGDNTTQTTAFQPSFVTNQINQFLSNNNTFTGEQNFEKLNIKDISGNSITEIREVGNDLFITNKQSAGNIYFKTGVSGNNIVTIDSGGRITTNNTITTTQLVCNKSVVDGVLDLSKDVNNNAVLTSLIGGKSLFFKTKQTNGTDGWALQYSNDGKLSGVNLMFSDSVETRTYKFREPNGFLTDSKMYLSSAYDLIFDNKVLGTNTSIKFINYDSLGNAKTILLNQYGNMSGLNDITLQGKIILANNSITHQYVNGEYRIDNKNNGSVIKIKNYDNSGIMRELTIDQFINMSGINDLRCNRLYIANSLIDFTLYNTTANNAQMLSYGSFPYRQTNIATGEGQISFVPYVSGAGAYNNITQAGDTVMYFNNTNLDNGGALVIAPWTTNLSGVRISKTETQIHNPKVMNNLKFPDNTVQTTAMTDSYLTSKIQSVINQMTLVNTIPIGTILPFGGPQSENLTNYNPPAGFLWCVGEMVEINLYPNLYNVIGHRYLYNKTVFSGFFYLPELQGAFLKGVGGSTLFTNQDIVFTTGGRQQANVGSHLHKYKDRGSGEIRVDMGTQTYVAKNDTQTFFLHESTTYDPITQQPLNAENRPNSVGVNYIIKY